MPIAIYLIEGLIQFWIIAPAAKGVFQMGEPIDANLDLHLRSVWKKNGFLKFDRGSVNFSFYSLCHNTSLLSHILPYLLWLGKERCGIVASTSSVRFLRGKMDRRDPCSAASGVKYESILGSAMYSARSIFIRPQTERAEKGTGRFSRGAKPYAASIGWRLRGVPGGFKPQPGMRLDWVQRVMRES